MTEIEGTASASAPRTATILPGLRILGHYRWAWLRGDLIAGVLLAAYLLPSALADASLANLPSEAGLYAALFAGLVFWLFSSSNHTAISPTTAISLLVGSSLGDLANGDVSRFGALAACTAILVGVLGIITWALRAGVIINFVSETVLLGFKCGIAFYLASTQLPKLFGMSGSHGSFAERIHHFAAHIPETNLAALALGLVALASLLLGKRYLKGVPIALFVVVAGIILGAATNMGEHGVKMLGEVPQGIPSLALPAVTMADLDNVLFLAMACFLLGAVETSAIGRMFALKHGGKYDPNQEFLALGMANLAAGFGRGFPLSGGLSQSLVNESGGARTSVSGLVAALVILVVVVFFSGLLSTLPQTVLAAIVLAAVTGLLNISALRRLWHFSHGEFAVAAVAMVGVLHSGILRGVLIAALLSLILLLRRASHPRTAELGRVPGTDYYADIERHPENQREPGAFIFRAESALLYFNSEYVRDQFIETLDASEQKVHLAVLNLTTVPYVDLAGVEMLIDLHRSLDARGIDLRLAEAHGPVRECLRRAGYENCCGPVEANQTVSTVIRRWKAEQRPIGID